MLEQEAALYRQGVAIVGAELARWMFGLRQATYSAAASNWLESARYHVAGKAAVAALECAARACIDLRRVAAIVAVLKGAAA